MVFDGVKHGAHVHLGQVFGLLGVVRHQHVEQPDRGTRLKAAGQRILDVALVVGGRILPAPLGNDQHSKPQLGHDLSRLGADR